MLNINIVKKRLEFSSLFFVIVEDMLKNAEDLLRQIIIFML